MAGPVFLLFLNYLGFGKSQIGIILGIIPFLGILSLFLSSIEPRFGYKRSYLSMSGALGFLKVQEAIVPIINYMAEAEHEITRQSLAYSVASIIGGENMFLLVLRHIRKNLAETREEVHYRLRKRLPKITENPKKVRELVDQILISSRVEDYSNQASLISEIVNLIPEDHLTPQAWTVVRHALPLYEKGVRGYRECMVLVLHALLVGSSPSSHIKINMRT